MFLQKPGRVDLNPIAHPEVLVLIICIPFQSMHYINAITVNAKLPSFFLEIVINKRSQK